MPEEINRVVADSLATYLFAPTRAAVDNLVREGTSRTPITRGRPTDRRHHVRRAAPARADAASEFAHLADLTLQPGGYVLATVHRAANTDDPRRLERIIEALALLREPVVLPMHPRTRAALAHTDIEVDAPVRVIEPVGYLDMLALEQQARMVLTDSGGVQKEAYLLGVPCVTLRDETEWVETLEGGWNVLAGDDADRILAAARRAPPERRRRRPSSAMGMRPNGWSPHSRHHDPTRPPMSRRTPQIGERTRSGTRPRCVNTRASAMTASSARACTSASDVIVGDRCKIENRARFFTA